MNNIEIQAEIVTTYIKLCDVSRKLNLVLGTKDIFGGNLFTVERDAVELIETAYLGEVAAFLIAYEIARVVK